MEKVDLVFGLTSVRQVVQLNRHAVQQRGTGETRT